MQQLIKSPWNNSTERLKRSFSAALALHLLILLGLGFNVSPLSRPQASMAVTLSQYTGDPAPEKADFLAQSNQRGSGDNLDNLEATSDRRSAFDANSHGGMPATQPSPETLSTINLLAIHSLGPNYRGEQSEKSSQAQPENDSSQSVGNIRAKLDRLVRRYSSLPKVSRMTSASTKTAEEAAYMHYFEQRIEQVGNYHYPLEARSRKLEGKVQLVVVITPNGNVRKISIASSSGSRVLDQAAVRSVRLAAPFRAFPSNLRGQDEIHVIRTWQYQANKPLTTK
jgi:protein TonB